MTTFELRNKVISKINQINDDLILAEVYRMLEINDVEDSIFQLSNEHKLAINEAISQIASGECLTNEEANQEINEWLNK